MNILTADFDDPQFINLLAGHLRGMQQHSPENNVFALDLSALRSSNVQMYALWEEDILIGMGGMKRLRDEQVEIKSMRTHPEHLRKGVAQRLLQHIIKQAITENVKLISLETGSGEAFEPAIRLYKKYGFKQGEAFSDYVKSPFNQFFHLALK